MRSAVYALSPRARITTIVAVCALAAGGVAAAVAWIGRGETAEPPAAASGPREGAPPLALDVLVADLAQATALQQAVRLYQGGQPAAARAAFERIRSDDPGSLYAAVGAAVSRWPDGALPALRALARDHPDSGLVKLHEGLVLFWLRQDAAAEASWRQAEQVDPDSSAAVRAEGLLHPEMPPGRPLFVPSRPIPQELAGEPPLAQLAGLEKLARERDDAPSWILYGVALQRAGRTVSAQDAFARAVAADPESVEALTAAAVGRFRKDDPSQTFSRLGPLSRQHPDAAVVRFHLGLSLLWLRDAADARTQLEAAARGEPGSIWAREATDLLGRLREAGAGGETTTG